MCLLTKGYMLKTHKDLTGMVFDCLTVKSLAEKHTNEADTLWVCECICGTQLIRKRHILCYNKSKNQSCGCSYKNNMIGKTKGPLTVIAKSPYIKYKNQANWTCECSLCGNLCIHTTSSFNNPRCKSCDCLIWEKRNNPTIKPYEHRLLVAAKSRAKLANLEYTLKFGDFLIPEFCPVLGIQIEPSKGRASDNSPSIDRLNPNEGYTKENIRIISWRANRLKCNATVADLESILNWLKIELAIKEGV